MLALAKRRVRAVAGRGLLGLRPPRRDLPVFVHPETGCPLEILELVGRDGPEAVFRAVAAHHSGEALGQLCLGGAWVLLVGGADVAAQITKNRDVGRGHAMRVLQAMIGDIFFVQDDPTSVTLGRKLFYRTVHRQDTAVRIRRGIESRTRWDHSVRDFYGWVGDLALEAVSRCFLGLRNARAFSPRIHEDLIRTTRGIVSAGVSVLPTLVGPQVDRDFRTGKRSLEAAMSAAALQIAEEPLVDSYVVDVAVELLERDKIPVTEKTLRHTIRSDGRLHQIALSTLLAVINLTRALSHVLQQLEDGLERPEPDVEQLLASALPIPVFPRTVLRSTSVAVDGVSTELRAGEVAMLVFDRYDNVGDWTFSQGYRSCPARAFATEFTRSALHEMRQAGRRLAPAEPLRFHARNGGYGPDHRFDAPIRGIWRRYAAAASNATESSWAVGGV